MKPGPAEVARLLRTRTVGGVQSLGLGGDTGPVNPGGFTTDTRPNLTEVGAVIETAFASVRGELVGTPAAEQEPTVRHAVALYAAVLIEVSFFREQAGDAAAKTLRELYTEAIRTVNRGIAASGAGPLPRIGTLAVSTGAPTTGPSRATVVAQLWSGPRLLRRLGPNDPDPTPEELDQLATALTGANDGVRPTVRVLQQAGRRPGTVV